MRPAAARPLRMGEGDSELADIGRAARRLLTLQTPSALQKGEKKDSSEKKKGRHCREATRRSTQVPWCRSCVARLQCHRAIDSSLSVLSVCVFLP